MKNPDPENPQEYFVTDLEQSNYQGSFTEKLQPAKLQAQKTAIEIWPSINRFINSILYYGLKIVKSIFKTALSMLRS